MLRFLLGLAGYGLMAGAFVTVVIDGTRSIASSSVMLTSVQTGLEKAWPALLAGMKASLTQASPWLWDPLGLAALRLPLAGLLAVAGVALVLLARPREETVGTDTRG